MKQGSGLPIVAKNIKLDARPTPIDARSAVTVNQQDIRSIDIRELKCQIEIPRPGQPTLILNVSMYNGKATIGTDLINVLSNSSANELLDIATKGRKKAVLPQDNTAIHITAKDLSIDYEQLQARVRYSYDPPPEQDTSCITGFDKGTLTFQNVRLGRPTSLLRNSPNQGTFFGCSSAQFKNSADLPALLDLESFELKDLDKKHDGSFTCQLKVHLDQIIQVPWLSYIAKKLLGRSFQINIDAPIKSGELSIADIKDHTLVQSSSWLVRKTAQAILSSPKTKIVCQGQGPAELQIGLPTLFRKLFPFITRRFINRKTPDVQKHLLKHLRLPLPLKGAFSTQVGAKQGEGKLVLTEFVGDLANKLRQSNVLPNVSGIPMLPGSFHFTSDALEDLAIAGGLHDFDACKRLLDESSELFKTGHHCESLRALQAIPIEQYAKIIKLADPVMRTYIHRAAHWLAFHDQEKSTQIYAELLKTQNPGLPLEEAKNPRWLVQLAERMKPRTEQDWALKCDILELACQADPFCGSLQQLVQLTPDVYPLGQLLTLVGNLFESKHYQGQLHRILSTIKVLDEQFGPGINPLLQAYPFASIIKQMHNIDLLTREKLDELVNLLEKRNMSCKAADIHLAMNERARAYVALDRGAEQGDSQALDRFLQVELRMLSKSNDRAFELGQRLLAILLDPNSSATMRRVAQANLIEYWDKTHTLGLGDDLLYIPKAQSQNGQDLDKPQGADLKHMACQLLDLPATVSSDVHRFDEVLDDIRQNLETILGAIEVQPGEKRLAEVFKQLVDDLQARNDELLFEDTTDTLENSNPVEQKDLAAMDNPSLNGPLPISSEAQAPSSLPGEADEGTLGTNKPQYHAPTFQLSQQDQQLFDPLAQQDIELETESVGVDITEESITSMPTLPGPSFPLDSFQLPPTEEEIPGKLLDLREVDFGLSSHKQSPAPKG